MPGRNKTPSAVKELRGTDQPCRINPDEPKPAILAGAVCPIYLQEDEVARQTWEWVIPYLVGIRVLTHGDLDTVASYCEVVSDLRELRGILKSSGRLLVVEKPLPDGSTTKDLKSNPAAVQYNNLLSQKRALSTLLGLNPSARASLKAEPPKEDEYEDVFDK